MKNILKFLIASTLFIAFAFIVSCDKIEEPFVKQTGSVDTAACPVPEFPAVTTVLKRVLLEDYTGHTCVNCPRAALIAHDLKQAHGEQLVLVAVHAGFFAKPFASGDFVYDFRTATGTQWDETFGIGNVGNPNGMINRIGFPNNHIISPSGWGAAVVNALASAPLVDLQMINQYDPDERKLCTHIKTRFITEINKNLKLVVVLTENNIIKPQKNNDAEVGTTPVIEDYEHNHVLRAAINSTWGNSVAVEGTVNPESVVKSFKYMLKDEFVPENCSVVAFVYDESTNEVLQALEVPVL
jgi:hypothetical protein